MRLAFAGTPEFATPTLRRLVSDGHDVLLVVTQPDRPSGRGREVHPPPVKMLALDLGLTVLQPESINDPEAVSLLRCMAPDALVVQAFGQKLSPEILSAPKIGCFNVHASLLPAYRGAAPINHAILRGETRTGITVMRMAAKIDAGEILAQEAIAIEPEWTAGDLSRALEPVGAELMSRTLAEVAAGRATPVAQDRSKVSKAPKLDKSDGLIPWEKSAREVYNHIRGMTPWPGAHTYYLKIAENATGAQKPASGTQKPLRIGVISAKSGPISALKMGVPGTVAEVAREGILVACGSGGVTLERVKPAGSREMSADEFVRGHGVRVGSTFVSMLI